MKLIGKVLEFDGKCGTIIDKDGNNYLVLKQDIYSDIKPFELVSFEKEVFEKTYDNTLIARYVKKI